MTLKDMYNQLAEQYAAANQFGAISNSHRLALEQIQETSLIDKPIMKILDCGIGDGAFLQTLYSVLPHAEYTGIDISSEMIKRAHTVIPSLKTFEISAAKASHVIPACTQNLVLAHFINAYVPVDTLFNEVNILINKNGYFSFITTTYDSFPVAQAQLNNVIAKGTFFSKIVDHAYKKVSKNTTVAVNEHSLLNTFSKHNFTVMKHKRLHIPIRFESMDELAHFAIEGAWFLNILSIKVLPQKLLINYLKRLFGKMFVFPYEDTHIIDIVLAKKGETNSQRTL